MNRIGSAFGRSRSRGIFHQNGVLKAVSLLLALAFLTPLCGVGAAVRAEDTALPGSCPHHPVHTGECGWRADVPDAPCTHQHDDACGYAPAMPALPCGHLHDESCGYRPASEGVPCAHEHDENCGGLPAAEPDAPEDAAPQDTPGNTQQDALGAACTHEHDESCGYQPAVAETPCAHTHDESCGYAEGAAEIPCTHTHDERCGYIEPQEGAPCGFVCDKCVTGWQWRFAEDEEPALLWNEDAGCWGLGLPGVSAAAPLEKDTLMQLLPREAEVWTAADDPDAEGHLTPLRWALDALPGNMNEGSYLLTAALEGEYLLAGAAPALEVRFELGGGETYKETLKFLNQWTFVKPGYEDEWNTFDPNDPQSLLIDYNIPLYVVDLEKKTKEQLAQQIMNAGSFPPESKDGYIQAISSGF